MLKSRVGYSIVIDSFTSGKETMQKAIDGCLAPKIGMLYSSCKYDTEGVIKGAKSVAPNLPIIGCTTSNSIMVSDGIISGENGFSGMMILDDENLKISLAASEKTEENPRQIGRKIAIEAVKKAETMVRPSYFYMVCSPKDEEFYLKGIQDVIGRVPMFGGSCADDNLTGEWKIYCDDKIFNDGCAVAFFYTDKRICTEFTGAYNETSKMGIITKVSGNRTITEIDGIPALKKYAEWRGVDIEQLRGNNLYSNAILSPLGVKEPTSDLNLIKQLISSNDDLSINVGSNVKVGTTVCLMSNSIDELIDSNKRILDKLKSELEETPGAYLLICDNGRRVCIENRINDVYDRIKEVVGNVPFIVIFTNAEYGYCDHSANANGNLMLSFSVFAE